MSCPVRPSVPRTAAHGVAQCGTPGEGSSAINPLATGYLAAAKPAGQVFERSVKRPSFGAAGTVFAFGIGSTAFSDHVPLDEICLYLFGRDCFNHLSACELDCFRLAVEIATKASRNARFPRPSRGAFPFAFGSAADVGIMSGATM